MTATKSNHVRFRVELSSASHGINCISHHSLHSDAGAGLGDEAGTGRAVTVNRPGGVVADDVVDMASRISGASVVKAVMPLRKTGLGW